MSRRPVIAVPGRLSAGASAIRFSAVLVAEALAELVWEGGGEPVAVLPRRDPDPGQRLGFADGVLLPGGGDLSPTTYGEEVASDAVYDVHPVMDAFDLAVARWALAGGVPLLAVCRGMQVVNVALGGTLEQDMTADHMDAEVLRYWHDVTLLPGGLAAETVGAGMLHVSCYHHQRVAVLADGLRPLGWAADGTVEALDRPESPGWFLGVQWHPEDADPFDPAALGLVEALTCAARRQESATGPARRSL